MQFNFIYFFVILSVFYANWFPNGIVIIDIHLMLWPPCKEKFWQHFPSGVMPQSGPYTDKHYQMVLFWMQLFWPFDLANLSSGLWYRARTPLLLPAKQAHPLPIPRQLPSSLVSFFWIQVPDSLMSHENIVKKGEKERENNMSWCCKKAFAYAMTK